MSAGGARDALTGLRFLAALHVVVFHFGGVWFEALPGWLQAISACGYASVGLFYVLSGFVLSYNYLTPDGRLKAEPRSFWAARLARVYPVYALALLLLAPPVIQGSLEANTPAVAAAKLLAGGLSALLLVHAWLPPLALYWNPPGWSVSVEAFFYAVFPLAAAWVGRLRRGQLWGALGGLWMLGLLPSLLYLGLQVDGGLNVLKFNPLLRLPEFLMGLVLGRFFLWESATPRPSGAFLATAAALLTLGVFAFSPAVPFVLLHNALLAPVFGALVYGLARGGGPLGWVLSRPLCVRLGEASYALYILQYPVWKACQALAEAVAPWADFRAPKPLFAVYLVLLVGLSWLTYRLFEMPLRSWGRKRLQGWVERGALHRPSASPGTP
ncbi:acyltransferase family protein [Stigmatella aurantiaca]|uniref:Acyltransferase family protein n=1 Tax=Stigmatella aurantiaca (strain DW4/3-1) TaxID=378806 RepID=Q08RC1_STIAD|nr:acyltransferase [Stigmatella aurantiaca]ADO68059.1 Acyltransferase family protein [Stigmatella aurantiaca DW4/3-1]EAU63042.1 mycarose O-acyltransferase [Stigmatella aurantiaca DW4/3-1]